MGCKTAGAVISFKKSVGLRARSQIGPLTRAALFDGRHEVKSTYEEDAPARSSNWARWGRVLDGLAVGCVVSMWLGKRKGASGHVGFVVGRDRFNNLMVLGGNQANRVSLRPFKRARVLFYHWPKDHKAPARIGLGQLPVVASDSRVFTNEG